MSGRAGETSAHIQQNNRMTIIFMAFESKPMILRLYGKVKVIHINEPEWQPLFSLFQPIAGVRQIFDLSVDLVQASCSMAVPFFDYVKERAPQRLGSKKGDKGLGEYWLTKKSTKY